MLNKFKLIQSFEEIIGWPYESPGTNNKNGIDCSGAFVRAYKQQGASIYHGSNTIYRKHCGGKGAISSAADLVPGMAVFKRRADGKEPSQYKNDGIGNMYHMGLVTAVNPLRIIHATTPVAKMDTALNNWTYYGRLSAVDYEDDTEIKNTVYGKASVKTQSGSLNMRSAPSLGAQVVTKIPRLAQVELLSSAPIGGFYQVYYQGYQGYASADYLDVSLDKTTDPALEEAGIFIPTNEPEKLLAMLLKAKIVGGNA